MKLAVTESTDVHASIFFYKVIRQLQSNDHLVFVGVRIKIKKNKSQCGNFSCRS